MLDTILAVVIAVGFAVFLIIQYVTPSKVRKHKNIKLFYPDVQGGTHLPEEAFDTLNRNSIKPNYLGKSK